MTDATLALIGLAILGLAVGSFLNVCIHRLPRGESIVRPGSRCPHCGYVLGWSDNVPVLSYVFLGGKCRKCRAGISMRYPIVELVTMAIYLVHALRSSVSTSSWCRGSCSRPCSSPSLPSTSNTTCCRTSSPCPASSSAWRSALCFPPGICLDSLIGILAGGGVLWLVGEAYYRYSGQEGMGGGDVKMLAMIGAFLGWKLMILTLVLSSILGSVVGVIVIAVKRGGMKYALPYGTFLSLAALVSSLFGSRILDWYLGFYQ